MDALDNIELDTSIRVVRIEFFRSVQRKDCYGTTIFAQEDGRCLPFECVHVSSLKARLMLPQNASRWRGQLPTISHFSAPGSIASFRARGGASAQPLATAITADMLATIFGVRRGILINLRF